MEKVENAVILLGSGRSGTTLLSHWLSLHPDMAWISNYNNAYPNRAGFAFLNRLNATSFYSNYFNRIAKLPKPAEAHEYWDYYFPDPKVKIEEAEPEEDLLSKCISNLNGIAKAQGKNRLMTKMTGPSRWPIFKHVFQKPLLIWIERDPVAVISSMMKLKWFYRDKLDDFNAMSTRERIDFYSDYLDEVLESKSQYPKELMTTIFYEDLVTHPQKVLNGICEALNLQRDSKWLARIAKWQIKEVARINYKSHYNTLDWDYLNVKYPMISG